MLEVATSHWNEFTGPRKPKEQPQSVLHLSNGMKTTTSASAKSTSNSGIVNSKSQPKQYLNPKSASQADKEVNCEMSNETKLENNKILRPLTSNENIEHSPDINVISEYKFDSPLDVDLQMANEYRPMTINLPPMVSTTRQAKFQIRHTNLPTLPNKGQLTVMRMEQMVKTNPSGSSLAHLPDQRFSEKTFWEKRSQTPDKLDSNALYQQFEQNNQIYQPTTEDFGINEVDDDSNPNLLIDQNGPEGISTQNQARVVVTENSSLQKNPEKTAQRNVVGNNFPLKEFNETSSKDDGFEPVVTVFRTDQRPHSSIVRGSKDLMNGGRKMNNITQLLNNNQNIELIESPFSNQLQTGANVRLSKPPLPMSSYSKERIDSKASGSQSKISAENDVPIRSLLKVSEIPVHRGKRGVSAEQSSYEQRIMNNLSISNNNRYGESQSSKPKADNSNAYHIPENYNFKYKMAPSFQVKTHYSDPMIIIKPLRSPANSDSFNIIDPSVRRGGGSVRSKIRPMK